MTGIISSIAWDTPTPVYRNRRACFAGSGQVGPLNFRIDPVFSKGDGLDRFEGYRLSQYLLPKIERVPVINSDRKDGLFANHEAAMYAAAIVQRSTVETEDPEPGEPKS
jgi:hypothetical protein